MPAEKTNGVRTFNPANREEWRKWLKDNHTSGEPVCLVIYHKASKTPNLTYNDAVEEALCFGWIDNKGLSRDDDSMYLQLGPRKEKSNWSLLNKERVKRIIKAGLMTPAGQALIDVAKKNGKWAENKKPKRSSV
jgi:uncharacterized protein YdeI (YjbR/CyaY-like superfamily)